MTPISAALSTIFVGPSRVAGRLTVFPLLSSAVPDPSYLLLDQALSNGLATVTEVSMSGSVPELRFENRSDQPILIVDGEALVGAKQNRIANITILAPPQTAITIPVSCVERGRWSYRRRDFAAADQVLYSESRARKAQDVSASLRVSGHARADQGAIWSGIAAKAARMSAESPSEAMDAIFERRQQQLKLLESQLVPGVDEVGAAFAIDGRILGFEMFDAPQTWRKFSRKVVRSYGLDSMDPGIQFTSPSVGIDEWMHSVSAASASQFPSIGLGQDLRIEHQRLSGGALLLGQTVVHCAVFDAAALS